MSASRKQPNENDRRVVKTKKAIRNAFRNIIVREGLHKLNVSKIAAEADIHRKTFYLHYSSVEDLLNSETESLTSNATKHVMESWDRVDERQGVRLLVSAINSHIGEDLEFFTKAARDISSDYIVEAGITPMRNIIEPLMEDGVKLTESEWDTMLRFNLSGIVGVYRHALMQGETDLDSFSPTIEELMLACFEAIKLHSATVK